MSLTTIDSNSLRDSAEQPEDDSPIQKAPTPSENQPDSQDMITSELVASEGVDSRTANNMEQQEPEYPPVIIEPEARWALLPARELWSYRELLFFLTWRDIKVRYKQTALGATWAIIQPLFTMLIFTFVFGRVAGLAKQTGDIPYALATYSVLVPWTFFATSVSNSAASLVNSSNLISKVYFPRLLVPTATVLAALVDFAIAFIFFLPLSLVYQHSIAFTPNLLLLPILVVFTALLALAVGLWMAAVNVKYRDVRYALPFIVQFWMFASPIFYWLHMLPADRQWLLMLNPLTGLLENYRSALFGLPVNWTALGISMAVTVGWLLYALFNFRRLEDSFADII